MLKKSSTYIKDKLSQALTTVGDMALKRRARRIIEELELQEGQKVLEIGCGNGYYLSLLNRLGLKLDLTGIDIDELALKDARKFIGDDKVKLVLGSAAKLPFKNSSFDRIIMSEVIEHVDDEERSLKEAYRVLKPKGVFSLTTCNIDYPFLWDPINWILQHFFRTHIKKGFWAGIWNQHDRMYKKEHIKNLVKSSGFEVQICEALTYWCLPFNHYIVNLIAKLFYSNKLPSSLSSGMNKFKNNKQPILLNLGFKLINLFDQLNDVFPMPYGVAIFIKSKKN